MWLIEPLRVCDHARRVLQQVKALFPAGSNPFVAGFGNRPTDELAYGAVGVPFEATYIVNPKGEQPPGANFACSSRHQGGRFRFRNASVAAPLRAALHCGIADCSQSIYSSAIEALSMRL